MLRTIWFVPPALATIARARQFLSPAFQLEATLTQSSEQQFHGLVSGIQDVAVTAIDNVFAWNARTQPREFRVIAQIERTTPLTLVCRSRIEGFEDLRGKDLLVDAPDNGFVVALRALLNDNGIPPGAYRLTPAGGVKQRLDALVEGYGDATLLGPPFDSMALAKGFKALATINAAYPQFPGQGLVCRAEVIAGLPQILIEWLAALDEARASIGVEYDEAAAALERVGFSAGAAHAMLQSAPHSLVPEVTGIELLIKQRRDLGLLADVVGYDDLVDLTLLKAIK